MTHPTDAQPHPDDSTRSARPTTRQRVLSAIAALCNCITAGSISTFPIWAPPLARSLHLTASQLNLVASSAILGEYATAAYWGAIADNHGPGAVSVAAGLLFALGYGLMGLVAKLGAQLDHRGEETTKLLWPLLGAYFLAGGGVAASYFSAMISSTKSAPARHSGLAIGVPCAVFGLSPLFLASLTSFFTTTYDRFPELPGTSEVELDPARWLLFLAALLALVNGIGGFFLKELPWDEEVGEGASKVTVTHDAERDDSASNEEDLEATERTSLLRPHLTPPPPHSQTLRQFVSTPTFWIFGAVILFSTGPVEAYMASLGQVLESLLAISTSKLAFAGEGISHALQARKNHIAVLAIANTGSRLIVGAVSDFLAENRVSQGRRRRVSRLVFLFGACASLSLVYVWGGTGLGTEGGLWIVTIINGVSYGAIFTLSPAIVRSCWPVENFGRDWGLLTWFSAVGALIFTPLFGILRDLATGTTSPFPSAAIATTLDVCASSGCYRPSFVVSAISAGMSCGAVAMLWRKWSAIV
ncbi:hypothetical protein JCM11491_000944 [Sporobolomyces phaffii]